MDRSRCHGTLPPIQQTAILGEQHDIIRTNCHSDRLDVENNLPRILVRLGRNLCNADLRLRPEHRHLRRTVRSGTDMVAIPGFNVHVACCSRDHGPRRRTRDRLKATGAAHTSDAGHSRTSHELHVW